MPPRELCKVSSPSRFYSRVCFRSAFFFFSNERRQQVQQDHPEWKVSQVAQELGKVWKAMSEEEKQVYERKANEDKARYAEEMKNYREQVAANPPPQPPPQQIHIEQHQQQPQIQRIVHTVPQAIHPHQQVIMVQQPMNVNGGAPQQIMMVPHSGQMEYSHPL